ncbi:uncharacterized protein BT62DRAFT_463828 [Guyanagaster necrorhizus]|uniref:Uncharacterized protein n=1 Tax=Guyanagaster necrorhizus TaxID=856835 RepID=A0A9P7VJE9_9AGAR|nr:uncharacterized protein BT62DRAFT_463828 [Guyanagaster necrorhizus MCA 3950]KAG7441789.1 hypothetical protein BT62DRAFT_463828 [Guyanagaster necrorhizus MCA 3950]
MRGPRIIKIFQKLPKVYSSPRARAIPRFTKNDYGKRHPPDDEELLDSIISYVQSCNRTFFGTTYARLKMMRAGFPLTLV